MSDLEQAGRTVVARPERGPTPLGRIEERARVLRRRRFAGRSLLGVGLAAALVAGIAVTLPVDDEDVVTTEDRTTSTTLGPRPLRPEVTIDETEISDGETITLRFRGFNPGTELNIAQCVQGATSRTAPDDCDLTTLDSDRSDDDGSGRAGFVVARRLFAGRVDCAERPGRCVVGVGERASGVSAVAALIFTGAVPPAVPVITVAPTADLVEGQLVTVTGTGFRPGETGGVRTCRADPPPVGACDAFSSETTVGPTTVGPDGSFRVVMPAMRQVAIETYPSYVFVDCAQPPGCVLAVTESANGPAQPIPVTFTLTSSAPSPPRLELEPAAAVGDGDEVTVVGSGFPVGLPVDLGLCPTDAIGRVGIANDCRLQRADTRVGTDGRFRVPFRVQRSFAGTDCAERPGRCKVGFVPRTNNGPLATVDLVIRA